MSKSQHKLDLAFDDAACWQAVTRRDRVADGQFWYGVRSTGVYCRPHCPSRTARRENVTFHATRESAVSAGYRPCKRCKPELNNADSTQAVTKANSLSEAAEEMPRSDYVHWPSSTDLLSIFDDSPQSRIRGSPATACANTAAVIVT
jgi:methylphosphotriester-DNA--protein-cysteine methyltransferase